LDAADVIEAVGALSGARSPLRSLSTADACWALASSQKHLILERLLPGPREQGQWSWSWVRRTAIGWWLYDTSGGAGPPGGASAYLGGLLDSVVAKLAQSCLTRIRTQDIFDLNERKSGKADEALFWFIVGGASIAKIRALLKTDAMSGDPALSRFFSRDLSSEPDVARKNAFKLLQIHRFHLAAAVFILSGALDDAVNVVLRYIGDLQLALILCRHDRRVAAPALRDALEQVAAPQQDRWLCFLLCWHLGDLSAAKQYVEDKALPFEICERNSSKSSERSPSKSSPKSGLRRASTLRANSASLFDGALRLAPCSTEIQKAARVLLG